MTALPPPGNDYEEGAGAPASSAWTAEMLLASTFDTTGGTAAAAGLASDAFLEWEAEAFLECPPRLE